MPCSIPDKPHYIARPDHHYSLSTAHYPLFSALCFHHFANPSSLPPAYIDFYFHHFHALTNCLFRKSFALINICVAPWCFSREFVTFRYLHRKLAKLFIFILLQALCRRQKTHPHWNQQLPRSFPKTPGVWVPQDDYASLDCRGYPSGENRRVASAMGRPTQKMWMTTPITIILNEKGNFAAAESGTTTRFMKK